MHTYLGISTTEHNGINFQVNVYKVALSDQQHSTSHHIQAEREKKINFF